MKYLTDIDFEHDTQAAGGATTGDWFVYFCDKDKRKLCPQWARDLWLDLYYKLKGKATCAYVNLPESRETQQRFNITHDNIPAVFYLRKGKYYRYKI